MLKTLSLFLLCLSSLSADILKQEGRGFLEKKEQQLILHLQGTPYERGVQHGALLKELIQTNIASFIDAQKESLKERKEAFLAHFSTLCEHTPLSFQEEMRGVAEGSGIPLQKILMLNLFPEMFHCSGITVAKEATKTGALYHVRVLDYAVGKNLQNSAVLMVVKPEEGHAFLSVGYAGFIGSVTGMNAQKIAIGEIGGQGYGFWDGIPMAFLMRMVLEKAASLKEAKELFLSSPRTCEYYYVLSDGKTQDALGIYATNSQIRFLKPGASYALLAPRILPQNYGKDGKNDKFFLSPCFRENTPYQTLLYHEDRSLAALFHEQLPYCLLLTGFSYPERYPVLASRIKEKYGQITACDLIEIIKQPVSRESNLHNAIFFPAELKVWISHAGPQGEPACDQPYSCFSLEELLSEIKEQAPLGPISRREWNR